VQLRQRCPRVKRDGTAGLVGCSIRSPPKAAPPSRRVRPPASIALDRDRGQSSAVSHSEWPGQDAPFGASCFAGKLRSPALCTGRRGLPARWRAGGPYDIPYVNPYVIPYALGVRTPGFAGRAHRRWSVPLRGAWSGQAEWCASRD
jgi:hypothetical protein